MAELSQPWQEAAKQAGLRATYRSIGEAAGVSHGAVSRLITEGRSSPRTIAAVAAALGVSETQVYRWADVDISELGPYVPPMEAHMLSARARAALDELIRAVVADGIVPAITTKGDVVPAARRVAGLRQERGGRD